MMKKIILTLLLSGLFHVAVAQNYKFGKVSEAELALQQHPDAPTADAAVLYREVKTEFQYTQDSGWYMVTDYFERIKIYTKEGFEWANKTIPLYQGDGKDKLLGLKGYTYYLDAEGKVEKEKLRNDGIFEEEISKYLTHTKITMPDVREGCVIEYKYTINSPFIFNIDEFRFQETIPVDKLQMVFKSPEYFVFKTHQRGWQPYQVDTYNRERTMSFRLTTQDLTALGGPGIPQTTTRELSFQETTYTVEMEKVPALKEESFAGNLNNYTTALQFEMSYIDVPGMPIKSYSTTWEDVSKSIYALEDFGGELSRSNYFEKDIDNLLGGISDPQEKIGQIFGFVLNRMNWNGFQGYLSNEGVKSAYKKGSGNVADINLMLVAMLRHAGLEANPVLVSTKSHGMPLFPTRNGFNYVIAAVQMPQGTLLLDATNKEAEVGVLKPEILNWQGRFIQKNGTSGWVSLSSIIPAVKTTMVNAQITPEGSITGKAKNRFTGNYGLQYRSKYKGMTQEAQRTQMDKSFDRTEISELKFENLQKLGQPVALEFDFQSLDAIEEVGGKLYFSPLVYLATKESPFTAETRQYPIDFGFPIKNRYIVQIALPDGYTVESLPENTILNLPGNMGSYRYLVSQKGNQLQLSVELAINQSFISAEEYGNLKKFYEMFIAKENEKVVLIKS